MTGTPSLLIPALLAVPVLAGAAAALARRAEVALEILVAGALAIAALVAAVVLRWAGGETVTAGGPWFRADALSVLHLGMLAVVVLLATVFARGHFAREAGSGAIPFRDIRKFALLWSGAILSMMVVLVSNNLGLMWVGLESTTVTTAFLVSLHRTPRSLEATWKYIIVCSVGIALAFMGTLLMAAASSRVPGGELSPLMWSRMAEIAGQLDPASVRIAFIFILVGYGTKAGLVPMHTWLPDAHSQAPAPVSALFSGFMINTGFYCILRYQAVMALVPGGAEWSRGLLTAFGIMSILVASVFIIFQVNLKRFLAYCSVEHMGIIALGTGLGGFGTFAALFHAVNHSVAKTLAFCSAGRLGQAHGTHEMAEIRGTLRSFPVWGAGLWMSLLALFGAAPLAIFFSEFLVARSAMDAGRYFALAAMLAGVGLAFIGGMRKAIPLAMGDPGAGPREEHAGFRSVLLVGGAFSIMFTLGLYMPEWLINLLYASAAIVNGVR
jgi:hydrogenase-4 component F